MYLYTYTHHTHIHTYSIYVYRSGSGCVITFLGQLLQQEKLNCLLLATDINIKALKVTKKLSIHNIVRKYLFSQHYSIIVSNSNSNDNSGSI